MTWEEMSAYDLEIPVQAWDDMGWEMSAYDFEIPGQAGDDLKQVRLGDYRMGQDFKELL